MKIVQARRIAFCALFCTAFASANAATVDLAKKYPSKDAKVVEAKDGSGKQLMYSGNGKSAVLVKKAKITHVAGKKAMIKRKNPKAANKLNPEVVGSKKITMQDYNRYAYRKSNSTKSGVPVTKAASEESDKSVKK